MNTNYGGPVITTRAAGYAPYNWVGRIMSANLREAIEWQYRAPITIKLQPLAKT